MDFNQVMNIWKAIRKRFLKKSPMSNFSWHPDPEQEGKIAKFLAFFSRYEYALKANGFQVKNLKEAKADWDLFIIFLDKQNTPVPHSLHQELAYLRSQPVRKQMADGTWQEIPRNTDWEWLLRSLTTIRNNLFHGGKQGSQKMLESPRDELLIDYGQKIMEEVLKVVPSIQPHFN